MNIKQERQFIQELLESGKLDSLSVQVIALNTFANNLGYTAVNGDVRKGFKTFITALGETFYKSLEDMQKTYNQGYFSAVPYVFFNEYKIVERVSLQYNKRTSKKLTSQLEWLKFIKED